MLQLELGSAHPVIGHHLKKLVHLSFPPLVLGYVYLIMRSKAEAPLVDLSVALSDELDWKAGTLRTFEHHFDISAWAFAPLSGLLAIGT